MKTKECLRQSQVPSNKASLSDSRILYRVQRKLFSFEQLVPCAKEYEEIPEDEKLETYVATWIKRHRKLVQKLPDPGKRKIYLCDLIDSTLSCFFSFEVLYITKRKSY